MEDPTLSTVEEIMGLDQSNDGQDNNNMESCLVNACDIVSSSQFLSNHPHHHQETFIRVKIDRMGQLNSDSLLEDEELLVPVTVLSTSDDNTTAIAINGTRQLNINNNINNNNIYFQRKNGQIFGETIRVTGPHPRPSSFKTMIACAGNNNNNSATSLSGFNVSSSISNDNSIIPSIKSRVSTSLTSANNNHDNNSNNININNLKRNIQLLQLPLAEMNISKCEQVDDIHQHSPFEEQPQQATLMPILTNTSTAIYTKEDEEEDDEFEDEKEFDECKFGAMRTIVEQVDGRWKNRKKVPVVIPLPTVHVLKRASLSLEEKMVIIKELSNGTKQSLVCRTRRLPKSTVQSIWKNRVKIQEAVEKIGSTRKRCRRAQHEDVEVKLLEWIETLKSQNVNVNGPQLRTQAQVFAKQLGITEFRSSTGWLDKFKTRHKIVFKKSNMKVNNNLNNSCNNNHNNNSNLLPGDKKVALDWVIKKWPSLVEGYFPENIFSVNEFGLYYNALPDQTTRLTLEACADGKLAEDRLTVLICVNSDASEKRKLVVVGNCRLSGLTNINNLPVKYCQNTKSWMTKEIFKGELREWDAELRCVGRNIIVVLDNSPAHTITETFSNIKLVFLPPVVAGLLQPLENDVVQLIKAQYRRLLLDSLIRKLQERTKRQQQSNNSPIGNSNCSSTVVECSVSVIESFGMLDCSWIDVNPQVIRNCFKKSSLQSVAIISTSRSASHKRNLSSNSNSLLSSQQQAQLDAAYDTKLLEKVYQLAGIPVPTSPQLTFSKYVNIDFNLQVTDQDCTNTVTTLHSPTSPSTFSSSSSSNDFNTRNNFALDSMDLPSCTSDVQNHLKAIRTWVTTLSSQIDPSIHRSLSMLENFALRQSLPQEYNDDEECGRETDTDSDLMNNLQQQINNMNDRLILSTVSIPTNDNDHDNNNGDNNNDNTTNTVSSSHNNSDITSSQINGNNEEDNTNSHSIMSPPSSHHGTMITFTIDATNNNSNAQSHAQLPHMIDQHFFAYLT